MLCSSIQSLVSVRSVPPSSKHFVNCPADNCILVGRSSLLTNRVTHVLNFELVNELRSQ